MAQNSVKELMPGNRNVSASQDRAGSPSAALDSDGARTGVRFSGLIVKVWLHWREGERVQQHATNAICSKNDDA